MNFSCGIIPYGLLSITGIDVTMVNYHKTMVTVFFTIIFTIIVRNNSFESLIFLQKSDELFVDYGEEKVRQAR